MVKSALMVCAVFFVSGSAAMAEVPAAAKECAKDVIALCGDQKPSVRRAAICIKLHFKELSPECQGLVLKAAAVGKACYSDVKKLCGDVKPGGGAIEACLKAHIPDISDACKEAAAKAKG
jgi:hypothetical protein